MGYTCYLCDVISKIHKSKNIRDDEEVLLDTLGGSSSNIDSRHFSRMSCSSKSTRTKNYHRAATGHYTDHRRRFFRMVQTSIQNLTA